MVGIIVDFTEDTETYIVGSPADIKTWAYSGCPRKAPTGIFPMKTASNSYIYNYPSCFHRKATYPPTGLAHQGSAIITAFAHAYLELIRKNPLSCCQYMLQQGVLHISFLSVAISMTHPRLLILGSRNCFENYPGSYGDVATYMAKYVSLICLSYLLVKGTYQRGFLTPSST